MTFTPKEASMKTKIAIVMYRGLIQAVYADSEDIEVNVVEIGDDLNIQDASRAMDATAEELGYQVY
jgi:hypothetical protein